MVVSSVLSWASPDLTAKASVFVLGGDQRTQNDDERQEG